MYQGLSLEPNVLDKIDKQWPTNLKDISQYFSSRVPLDIMITLKLYIIDDEIKKILILYPHFPPSNLAGVHRPRLFAQHLPSFGWQPTILTVHEKYYEGFEDNTNL